MRDMIKKVHKVAFNDAIKDLEKQYNLKNERKCVRHLEIIASPTKTNPSQLVSIFNPNTQKHT